MYLEQCLTHKKHSLNCNCFYYPQPCEICVLLWGVSRGPERLRGFPKVTQSVGLRAWPWTLSPVFLIYTTGLPICGHGPPFSKVWFHQAGGSPTSSVAGGRERREVRQRWGVCLHCRGEQGHICQELIPISGRRWHDSFVWGTTKKQRELPASPRRNITK